MISAFLVRPKAATVDDDPPDDALSAASDINAWTPILLFFGISSLLFWRAGFRISSDLCLKDSRDVATLAIATALLLRRPAGRSIGFFFNTLLQAVIVTFAGMMFAYAAATTGRPLVDSGLLHIDQMLGYDWRIYSSLFSGRPFALAFIRICYSSIFIQPILILATLAYNRQYLRTQRFIRSTMIALIVTTSLFALFPATTAWTSLHLSDSRLADLRLPDSNTGWIHDLLEIRSGGGRLLTSDDGSGLIAFPSFHCCSALMFCWAIWPMARLRVVFLVLNFGMIAATPILGGHYFVDLLAGAAVAASAIATAGKFQRAVGRPDIAKPRSFASAAPITDFLPR